MQNGEQVMTKEGGGGGGGGGVGELERQTGLDRLMEKEGRAEEHSIFRAC